MQNIQCELPDHNPLSPEIHDILARCKTIAVVGVSPKEARDSNRVARYLLEQGYEVIPVNPGQKKILGKICFRSISDIPCAIDMADLFVSPSRVAAVVDQCIDKAVDVIWMQPGVVHNAAGQKAREAGIQVVMNKCIMQEHKKMTAP